MYSNLLFYDFLKKWGTSKRILLIFGIGSSIVNDIKKKKKNSSESIITNVRINTTEKCYYILFI